MKIVGILLGIFASVALMTVVGIISCVLFITAGKAGFLGILAIILGIPASIYAGIKVTKTFLKNA